MRRRLQLLPLLFILISGACRESAEAVEEVIISDYTDEAYLWADSVMRTMTIEERVGQMLLPAVMSRGDIATEQKIREYIANQHVGGILLLGGDIHSAAKICGLVEDASPVIPFTAVDAEWGLAMRFPGTPLFPRNSQLADRDEQFMYDYGNEVARECRHVGINMVLGPVLDVARPGSYISYRSFGGDPHIVSSLGNAYARGLEDGMVISVAKHFPGHGATSANSHKTLPLVNETKATLDSVDLLPFKNYISNSLSGIMIGHLSVPALDSLGISASVSKSIIDGFLRNELSFNGLILTDALNMEGASGHSALDAIMAGSDMVIAPRNTQESYDQIMGAVRSGELKAEVVNQHCRRILFYKYRLSQMKKEGRISPETLLDSIASRSI